MNNIKLSCDMMFAVVLWNTVEYGRYRASARQRLIQLIPSMEDIMFPKQMECQIEDEELTFVFQNLRDVFITVLKVMG